MSRHASGHSLADRRFEMARGYAGDGDLPAAIDLAVQALELAPAWAAGHVALGEWRAAAGDAAGARAAFAAAIAADPADAAGAALRLARIDGSTPAVAPPAHVAALFDDYAARFDTHLVDALGYRAPELITAALDRIAPRPRFARALDLGCGTGLMGERLRARCDWLGGVDLSPAMVAEARRKGLYDGLDTGDMVRWLDGMAVADLVVAADVFVYVGDLDPVFGAVARALRPGGLFAFTAQATGGDGYALGDDLRHAHSESYLRARAAGHGFALETLEPAVTRRDAGRDVPGWLAVTRRMV